jgi:hypothetical protein
MQPSISRATPGREESDGKNRETPPALSMDLTYNSGWRGRFGPAPHVMPIRGDFLLFGIEMKDQWLVKLRRSGRIPVGKTECDINEKERVRSEIICISYRQS